MSINTCLNLIKQAVVWWRLKLGWLYHDYLARSAATVRMSRLLLPHLENATSGFIGWSCQRNRKYTYFALFLSPSFNSASVVQDLFLIIQHIFNLMANDSWETWWCLYWSDSFLIFYMKGLHRSKYSAQKCERKNFLRSTFWYKMYRGAPLRRRNNNKKGSVTDCTAVLWGCFFLSFVT